MSRFKRWGRRRARYLRLLLIAGALSLILWAFRELSLAELRQILLRVDPLQLLAWVLLNGAVLVLMNGRWWLLLHLGGHNVPFWQLLLYRLASFSISLITPGGQFGGEPLQIFALSRRHDVPTEVAAGSVALDKLIEVIISASVIFVTVLLFAAAPAPFLGSSLTLERKWLFVMLLPIMLPLIYLYLLFRGYRPVASLIPEAPVIGQLLSNSETVIGDLVVDLRSMFTILVLSVVAFFALFVEFGSIIWLLDGPTDIFVLVFLFMIFRLSLWAPTPGGVGAVEAGQVLAFELIGNQLELAVGVILLIRCRDLLLALLGLRFAGTIITYRPL